MNPGKNALLVIQNVVDAMAGVTAAVVNGPTTLNRTYPQTGTSPGLTDAMSAGLIATVVQTKTHALKWLTTA